MAPTLETLKYPSKVEGVAPEMRTTSPATMPCPLATVAVTVFEDRSRAEGAVSILCREKPFARYASE